MQRMICGKGNAVSHFLGVNQEAFISVFTGHALSFSKDLDLWDKNKECCNRDSQCVPSLVTRLWRMCVGICSSLDLLITENIILQLC